ncbi:MAG: hypothetical protein AAGH90_09405 [Pseudomonadota bacterium]
MRFVCSSLAFLALSSAALAQSAEETEKAIDCLALTEIANDKRSIPDTAQLRQWRSTVETSPHCKQSEEGVELRVEEYRKALKEADQTRRFALELLIESEAEKCVSGAARSSYEKGI